MIFLRRSGKDFDLNIDIRIQEMILRKVTVRLRLSYTSAPNEIRLQRTELLFTQIITKNKKLVNADGPSKKNLHILVTIAEIRFSFSALFKNMTLSSNSTKFHLRLHTLYSIVYYTIYILHKFFLHSKLLYSILY